MSNYILSNNSNLTNIFNRIGVVTSDVTGSTGINMSVISGDPNPLVVKQTINNDITFQSGSTAAINIVPNAINGMSVGTTGIFLNPNNSNNIIMYNNNTTCYKQFNYGAIDVSSSSTYTLNIYDPLNVFVYSSTNFTLAFPTSPPAGTFFRIIKVPATVTTTFTITLSGGTFSSYRSVGATISNITTLPTAYTVFECIYIQQLNIWQISSY
jgi:hypothetical protein